jgi:hypothetical protein
MEFAPDDGIEGRALRPGNLMEALDDGVVDEHDDGAAVLVGAEKPFRQQRLPQLVGSSCRRGRC